MIGGSTTLENSKVSAPNLSVKGGMNQDVDIHGIHSSAALPTDCLEFGADDMSFWRGNELFRKSHWEAS